MRLRTSRGIVAETLLIYVVIGMFALFVRNPISTIAGVGVQPNKTVHVEKVELLRGKDGNPIATKIITQDDDVQEKVSFWEWLRSLPTFVLLLMGLGIVFPPVAIFLAKLRSTWKAAFKNTFDGLASLRDTTVICRKCGDSVTIDTKEHVFDGIEKKLDKRDKKLQEVVRTELVK